MKKFNGTEALENIVTQLTAKAEAAGNQLYLDTTEPIDVYADYDRFVQSGCQYCSKCDPIY